MFKVVQGKEMRYCVYAHPDAEKEKLPLIVFLHGAGERGDALCETELTLKIALPTLITQKGMRPRCVIVCPQCERDTYWISDIQRTLRFIDEVEALYGTDPNRVALTGVSMGGFGTWCTALSAPKRFFRIAPVCGGGMPWAAPMLWMPIRAFHGDADTVVLPSCSIDMVNGVKAGGNPNVSLTIYPGVGHNAWDYAYDESLLAFLLGEEK